jgi:hypothetical protein
MSVKVYIKKGARNYKENRLVQKLQPAIEKMMAENPQFASEFKPAMNFGELQSLHDKYVVQDVEFEEMPKKENSNDNYDQHKNFREGMKEQLNENKNMSENTAQGGNNDKDMFDDNDTFIDPLNREEPLVRDYVTSEEFPEETNKTNGSTRTTFEEPKSFKDSFEFDEAQIDTKSSASSTSGGQQNKPKKDKPANEPVNPHFDEMNNGKKKKSTRKFAKYIVETVCMLSEKGFVWFANKDINDSKLAEYELNDEMDLDLLVTLEDGQQATVKQFFQMHCYKAEQLSKIDPEEKSDLADALAEVLLEKGVGPTPTQELMLISLKIFGGQAVALFSLKSQTNSLLAQLREIKEQQGGQKIDKTYTPQPQPAPEKVQVPEQENKIQYESVPESFVETAQDIDETKEMKLYENNYEELGIIEKPVQTLE